MSFISHQFCIKIETNIIKCRDNKCLYILINFYLFIFDNCGYFIFKNHIVNHQLFGAISIDDKTRHTYEIDLIQAFA